MSDEWDDEYDEYDEEPTAAACGPCPECRAEIDVDSEMCPKCGYWLTTAERHKLWDGGSSTKAALSVGQFLLVLLLAVLFLGSMFGMIH